MLLFVIIISSSLAIYMHYKGLEFDPIREIQRLKSDNRQRINEPNRIRGR
jgi:hypothetical protein